MAVGGDVTDQRTIYNQPVFNLPAAPPGAPPFVVPYPPNPLFTGRDAELARLGAWLDGGACVAVVGTGGLGKTQLAAEYAHAARAQYPGGVFWLNMEQPEGIAGQVAALAGPGGLNLPAAPALDFVGKVAAVRAAWTAPVARLLIFDNLEDPKVWKEWRPAGGGTRVLITSRRQTWAATSGIELLSLQPLVRPASQELLLAPRAKVKKTTAAALLADPATAADADAICEALGDLPLALALAGAYLEATPSVTLARYRAVIEAAPLARLEIELEDALPTGHEASILKTFALSYDKLDATRPDDVLGLTLLHRAALLAPAPIPRRLALRLVGLDIEDAEDAEQADRAIRRLSIFGLIEDLDNEGVRLHPLLGSYACTRAPNMRTDSIMVEEALIDEAYVISETGHPLAGVPYLSHLRHAALAATTREDESAAALFHSIALLLYAQGDWVEAESLFECALAIREKILDTAHPDIASSLDNLGLVLKKQGDLERARPLYEQALTIRERTLGPSHPDIAESLNNLAVLMQERGELTEAKSLFERALAIYEQTQGSMYSERAIILSNLAMLLQRQGDLLEAKLLLERALEICEHMLSPLHSTTAVILNNLGGLLQDLSEPSAAQPLYEQALTIHKQIFGLSHPNTAMCFSNLGGLLLSQGDFTGARLLFEQAHVIFQQTLGPDHPTTRNMQIGMDFVQKTLTDTD